MSEITRGEFNSKALRSLLAVSLVDILYSYDALAEDTKPLTGKWVAEIDAIAREVKDKKIKQLEWQKRCEQLLKKVDLNELLRLVDFEKLTQKIKYRDKGELSLRFNFQKVDGIPSRLVFGKQIFALKKGRSVVPHGHDRMATAFIILKGKLHGRHYDRVKDQKDSFIIKPTIDRGFGPGQFSTVSDYKDNVHWFTAKEDGSFIFNFHVLGIDAKDKKRTGRVYMDPNGEKTENGLIVAPRLNHKEAYKRFG